MTIRNRLQLATQALLQKPVKNSASLRNARQFLKYGNKTMVSDWSKVLMEDTDNYTGFMYGAINLRAVASTKLGEYNLKTKAKPELIQKFKQEEIEIIHPYIELIEESNDFSDFDFWYDNATYLDLKGVAYIMAVRNIGANGIVGKVQYFKILNPYEVQRIFDNKTGELIGYKEYRAGSSRDIPKEMIIPVINLNPFNRNEAWAMVDAAKDNQFTLKTANEYTRAAIANNQNAPGIISTDAVLEGQELQNFKDRVMGRVKGEPIFGGGAGSITWQDMQTDLNKAALTDVNAISLQNIIAASGASKTMLGWEESGTTRDTAKVQKDNFTEFRAMPLVQKIVDALNQDFKRYYKTEYERTKYKIYIDNPLLTDRDAEMKDLDIREKSYEIYTTLLNRGYERELAAKYADGKISLEELGDPTNEPQTFSTPTDEDENVDEEQNKLPTEQEKHLQQAESGLLNQTQASLQNTIINIDNRLLSSVANRIGTVKNDFEQEDDIITDREKKAYQNELEIALAAFYGIILPLWAYNTLSSRLETFGKPGTFKMNNQVRSFIKTVANKASTSHIDTLVKSMMDYAQKQALAGTPRDQIAKGIINKFGGEITNSRAVAIARTETNRAFTMSQYQADLQFIKQNGFETRAFKQWVTRSDNPCPFCQEMARQDPIPFDVPFAEIGDEMTATSEVDGKTKVQKMTVGFLDAEAGNLHVNCGCTYELIIEEA